MNRNLTGLFSFIVMLSHLLSCSSFRPFCLSGKSCKGFIKRQLSLKASVSDSVVASHESFLRDIAKVEPPKQLKTLLEFVSVQGNELVDPNDRAGLNPFLIPIAKNTTDNSLLCFMRWPTQKEGMDLQLVRTNECGITLTSPSTSSYCHRLGVEFDFYGNSFASTAAEMLKNDGISYTIGEFVPFLKSGKFPAITDADLRLVLDRYLLTKVGPFPDCYERLAKAFFDDGNDVSGLITCERAVSVFYGWGHPIFFHAKMLNKLGRDTEAKDTIRASLGMPVWTIASSNEELLEAVKLAGYTGLNILGELHFFRASDARTKDIEEGLSPIQVVLDQAAHLMDAVALGSVEGGWDSVRADLSQKYKEGGYPDMANLIKHASIKV